VGEFGGITPEGSVALSLVTANEGDPDQVKGELHDVVKRLFADAGVTFDRVSRRGDPYSVADEAYNEYFSWYDYPCDQVTVSELWE
jgi:hypothetical protein